MAESFFATLEKELIQGSTWHTQAEARRAIFDFIEVWYNQQRRHSSLGYRTPAEFEQHGCNSARSPNYLSAPAGEVQYRSSTAPSPR